MGNYTAEQDSFYTCKKGTYSNNLGQNRNVNLAESSSGYRTANAPEESIRLRASM